MQESKQRMLLSKKLKEAKEDIRRKQEAAKELEDQLIRMDQEEAGKLIRRYHVTPGELNEMLSKRAEEQKKLMAEGSEKGNVSLKTE